MHLDESVGISGPYGPARHGLTDGEGVVRPVAGRMTDPLPLRLEPLAVRRQTCLAENLGVLGGCSVEAVQLRGELQVHQAGCELHRIGPTLHAGPVMHLRQPQGDAAEPAVGVVDVVNGLVGAAVGVLGQTRRGVVLARVAEIGERVDHVFDAVSPAVRLAIGDEIAVRSEGVVDASPPGAHVRAVASRRSGLRQQALTQPPVRGGMVQHDSGQSVLGELLHEAGQVFRWRRIDTPARCGRLRPDEPGERGERRNNQWTVVV